MSTKKPKIYLFLKILGFVMLFLGILLIILGTAVFPEMFNGHSVGPNPALFVPGMILVTFSVSLVIIGFSPDLQITAIKTQKYLTEYNKDDLKDIADMHADITGEGITKTASAIKKGLKDTKFCKYCGKEIDSDSKYCNECGKQQ